MSHETGATDDLGLIGFLRTSRSFDELRMALAVIEEFKAAATTDEYIENRFPDRWVRLEQLEGYIRLLTGDGAGNVRDDVARRFLAEHRAFLFFNHSSNVADEPEKP